MSKKAISQFLVEHAGTGPASFHMPGHKGSALYRKFGYDDFLDNFADCDITEIPEPTTCFRQRVS